MLRCICTRNVSKLRKLYPVTHNSLLLSTAASNRRKHELEISKLAKLADSSVFAKMDNTSILVTCVSNKNAKDYSGFVPLTVDFREKSAAYGKIPINALRRDIGPSVREILTGRLIDRSVRPLFPKTYSQETQIVCNLLASDGELDAAVMAINGASAALHISSIPWHGPIGAVRVGRLDGSFIFNPCRKDLEESDLNLVVSANEKGNIVMLDGSSNGISHSDLVHALSLALIEINDVIEQIKSLPVTKPKCEVTEEEPVDPEIENLCVPLLDKVFTNHRLDKQSRDAEIKNVRSKLPDNVTDIDFVRMCKSSFRRLSFESRCDGRTSKNLRPISCSADVYSPLHGSALFERGQTQVLTTLTFDSLDSFYKYDLLHRKSKKPFILHYEFPPYATNEIGRIFGISGRRELGHGALAEKALYGMFPNDFSFTVRLMCEVLESNGSSSMASVCGGSLALMDAGVPIKEHVAGIAMGLITEKENNDASRHLVLTDINGIEDYFGDMDFKIAGTAKQVTALQADVKLEGGVPFHVIVEALVDSQKGRIEIIDKMNACISEPRAVPKSCHPVVENIRVPIAKRHKLLGVGGINLQKLSTFTGVTVSALNDENYMLFAPNSQAMSEGKTMINDFLTEDESIQFEFGGIYTVRITEIRPNGVMVQMHPKMKPTLLHITQLDPKKVSDPKVLGLHEGQDIKVKYFGTDPVTGAIRLSRKVLYSSGSAAPVRNFIENKNEKKSN